MTAQVCRDPAETEGLRALIVEALRTDVPVRRHGQLCPVWVRRARGATWRDCDCWQIKDADHTADRIVAALSAVLPDDRPAGDELRAIVKRTARMGLCSQTHHEHLSDDELRANLAALNDARRRLPEEAPR